MDNFSVKQKVAGFLGSCLLPLFSKRANKIRNGDFTLAHLQADKSKLDKILRLGLLHNIFKNHDTETLAEYHRQFWQGDSGAEYHQQGSIAEIALALFPNILADLDNYSSTKSFKSNTLCEIGCGSGKLLHQLSKSASNIDNFIGIDLSPDTVKDNRERYKNNNIQFFASDAMHWIKSNAGQNWVFLSFAGVLEYFPEDSLVALLQYIKQNCSPCLFFIVEPMDKDYDTETMKHSIVYGSEYAFTHNYQILFEQAGFTIQHSQIKYCHLDMNLLYLIASSEP